MGITRNISNGGISFESQKYSLEPGDSIDFTLKDPDHNLVVSSSGEIIWKRHSSKFDCVSGIKFKETDSSIESRMLDILSKSGIPHVKRDYSEADPAGRQSDAKEKSAVPQLITCDRKTAVSPAGEGRGGGDMSLAGIAQVDEDNHEDQHEQVLPLWRKVWFYAPLLFLFVVFLVIVLPERFDKPPPLRESFPAPSDTVQDRAVPGKEKPEAVQAETPGKKSIDVQTEKPGDVGEPVPPVIRIPPGKEYYVQVGSWKNPQYAQRTLSKIIKYYPETVIVTEGGFYRIIIPGVPTPEQGEVIVKDIKEKINLQALLVLRKK